MQEDMSIQEKKVYLHPFLNSFLTFLIHIGNHSLMNCQKEHENCEDIAYVLNRSITLLWQIHVTSDILKLSYLEINFENRTSLTHNNEQAKQIIKKLHHLKKVVTMFSCFNMKSKQACLLKLEQIQTYYIPNSFIKIEDNENTEPWIASVLKQNKQS